jgi:histone arginine demethylase JMJD6
MVIRGLFRLLIGPERSGSGIHVDPILTCAWNTSLIGCKRWVLFDGKAPEHIVTGK